jgi:hypothetical protein
MKKREFLKRALSIFLCIITCTLSSQNDLENHKKYWYYKSHFNNDFIKVGLGAGESIPFNERSSGANKSIPSFSNKLHTGDGTARLGLYLSVLATEFRLLKDNNQDVTNVKNEIFCALSAINRLDFNAETFFGATGTQSVASLNGFFVRDDIPENFVFENYKHFNYFNSYPGPFTVVPTPTFAPTFSVDHGFTHTETQNMFITGSCLSATKEQQNDPSKPYNEAIHGFEESQDQLYYLLMGLTLTNKLVDANETNGNSVFALGSGETKLAKEAANISERLINHVKNDPLWNIRNPAHKNTPNLLVQTGGPALVYSYPLDNLGDFIKNNESLPFWFIPILGGGWAYPHTPTGSFRNLYSASPASSAGWQILANSGGGLNSDQQGFFHAMAGISNSVYENMSLLDLNVQAAINSLQGQASVIQNSITQAYNDFVSASSGMPTSVVNLLLQALNTLVSGLQTLLNGIMTLVSTYNQFLHPSVLINVTDIALQDNTLNNPVFYFNNCTSPTVPGQPQIPIVHYGSDMYFGIYLRDALHGFNFSLPSGLAFINSLPAPSHIFVKNAVEGILNSAPCEGNFNFKNGDVPQAPHWGASCFMDRVDMLWRKSNCNGTNAPQFGNSGEYSGLDYLLLHNLFYLTETTSPAVVDFIDRRPAVNFPFNSTNFNTANSSKATFGSYEKIIATNTINSNGAVIYRTGKEIALLPDQSSNSGFSVLNGADFDAVIEQYTCSAIGNTLNKLAPGAQAPPDDFFVEEVKSSPKLKTHNNEINEGNLANSQDYSKLIIPNYVDTVAKSLSKYQNLLKHYNKMNIYPNPNDGHFFLSFNLEQEAAKVEIMDVLGRIVFEEHNITGIYEMPINIEKYNKGIYIVKLSLSTGSTEIKKITLK